MMAPPPMAEVKAAVGAGPSVEGDLASKGSVVVKLKAKMPTTAIASRGLRSGGLAHT